MAIGTPSIGLRALPCRRRSSAGPCLPHDKVGIEGNESIEFGMACRPIKGAGGEF
ncbi:hypothetical protein [Bradyrhizobium sp. USDA 4529]